MIEDTELKEIERNARERFDQRVESEDDIARALGWDSVDSMETRFHAASEMFDFTGARVLDVGCGFGDFYDYLVEHGQAPGQYYGVDISDRVLDVARERHTDSRCQFERRNVLLEPFEDETFDVSVEFGLLNYNFEDTSNEAYARHFMDTCWSFSDTVLLNALSSYRQGDWEFEEFVYYYDPEKLFGYAQELTRDIVLKHDVEPIPQKELFLLLQ